MRQRDVPVPTGVQESGRETEQAGEGVRAAVLRAAGELHQHAAGGGGRAVRQAGRAHILGGRHGGAVQRVAAVPQAHAPPLQENAQLLYPEPHRGRSLLVTEVNL